MRIGNKTKKWNPSMTEVHNEGHIASNPHIKKELYVQWRNAESQKRMLKETRDELQNFWLSSKLFNSSAFDKMLKVSGVCVPNTYYRKISQAEWNAINGAPNPFKPVFDHHNTANYRYWISSSLGKVREFGNENATDASGIIIKLVFSADIRHPVGIVLKAHQEAGVQGNPHVIALHREGFAQIGNIDKDSQITEIRNRGLDHNLGFTSAQLDYLKATLVEFSRVL